VPTLFTLVAPAAFDPVMLCMFAFLADYAYLVSFLFKMVSASFFAIKMCCESKYVHRYLFNCLKDNEINQIMSIYGYSIKILFTALSISKIIVIFSPKLH